jgi:mevalonate kinase
MLYKASAPANLMILGEYAVINGNPAVVCALNKRLSVSLQPRNDQDICIHSALGDHLTNTSNLEGPAPFNLTLACLREYDLPSGCDITIDSEFSHTLGLGSSAALVGSLCYCLSTWIGDSFETKQLWQHGIRAIRSLSPLASGADLAASLVGGALIFKNNPFYVEPIYFSEKISVVYSGSKLESQTAVASHANKQAESPKFITALEQVSNELVTEFIVALEDKNWDKAGQKLNAAHGLLHTLGVSNERLDSLTWLLRDSLYGAKISGSGLGDCVIGLGQTDSNLVPKHLQKLGCKQLNIDISLEGVRDERD